MFRIFKKKKPQEKIVEEKVAEEVVETPEPIKTPEPQTVEVEPQLIVEKPKGETTKAGLFSRLKQGLSRTGSSLTEGVSTAILGKKQIDDDVLE